jgi:hypothetical protein
VGVRIALGASERLLGNGMEPKGFVPTPASLTTVWQQASCRGGD